MADWHCQKCEMNFAAATPPEKCPACGAAEVVKRGSPMSLAGKLKQRYQCDGCDQKNAACSPENKKGRCCD